MYIVIFMIKNAVNNDLIYFDSRQLHHAERGW